MLDRAWLMAAKWTGVGPQTADGNGLTAAVEWYISNAIYEAVGERASIQLDVDVGRAVDRMSDRWTEG